MARQRRIEKTSAELRPVPPHQTAADPRLRTESGDSTTLASSSRPDSSWETADADSTTRSRADSLDSRRSHPRWADMFDEQEEPGRELPLQGDAVLPPVRPPNSGTLTNIPLKGSTSPRFDLADFPALGERQGDSTKEDSSSSSSKASEHSETFPATRQNSGRRGTQCRRGAGAEASRDKGRRPKHAAQPQQELPPFPSSYHPQHPQQIWQMVEGEGVWCPVGQAVWLVCPDPPPFEEGCWGAGPGGSGGLVWCSDLQEQQLFPDSQEQLLQGFSLEVQPVVDLPMAQYPQTLAAFGCLPLSTSASVGPFLVEEQPMLGPAPPSVCPMPPEQKKTKERVVPLTGKVLDAGAIWVV